MYLIQLIILITFFLLSCQSLGLDCDHPSHSCESCVDFNCFWCEGEDKSKSFCTSTPHHCSKGFLLEDTSFCPKVEAEVEYLEWWGENAFFSRQSACSDFSGHGCVVCLTQPGLSCGHCSTNNDCFTRETALPCQQLACLVDAAPVSTTNEDFPVSLNVNPLFLVFLETNSTQLSTSGVMAVTAIVLAGECTSSFDPPTDTLTATPALEWNGVCQIEITATGSLSGYFGVTRLVSLWTVHVIPVNDPPKVLSTFAAEVAKLNPMKEDISVVLDGCKLFTDVDHDSISIAVTGNILDSVDFQIPAVCNCVSASSTCLITVRNKPTISGGFTTNFVASDGIDQTTSDDFDVQIVHVNHPPVASQTIVSVTVSEDTPNTTIPFTGIFSDPDPNDSLTLLVGANIYLVATDYSWTDFQLTVYFDQIKNGHVVVPITARDQDNLNVTISLDLTVTPVDEIIVIDNQFDNPYVGDSGTNLTLHLTNFVHDEETSFASGNLTCSVDSDPQQRVVIKIVGELLTIFYQWDDVAAPSVVSFTVTCRDTSPNTVDLPLSAKVNVVNHPPISIAPLPVLFHAPPASGTFSFSPINLTNYFKDPDFHDSLTYSNGSFSSAIFLQVSGVLLTVSLNPEAIGAYDVLVIATDKSGAFVTQHLSITAYVAPYCNPTWISTPWDIMQSQMVDLATICHASSTSLTLTFVPANSTTTFVSWTTNTSHAIRITFSSSNYCLMGSYSGMATLSDGMGSADAQVHLFINNTAPTVAPLKSTFKYFKKNRQTDSLPAGYDGFTVDPHGSTAVQVALLPLVQTCGTLLSPLFTIVTNTYHFVGGEDHNQRLQATISNDNRYYQISAQGLGGALVRGWTYTSVITVHIGTTRANFTLIVSRNPDSEGFDE